MTADAASSANAEEPSGQQPPMPWRRPGYYLFQPNGTLDSKVLATPFNAEYEACCGTVLQLHPISLGYQMVMLSHRELHSTVDRIAAELPNVRQPSADGLSVMMDWNIETLHRVMTFLGSVRSFLDHTASHLTHEFGKQGREMVWFTDHTHRLYDTRFSYRFLSQLRHMSQHVAIPVSALNLRSNQDSDTGNISSRVRLDARRDDLLIRWSEWKPQVRREIESQPEIFDLLTLIDEQLDSIGQLFQGIVALRANEFRHSLHYLLALHRVIGVPPGAVPVVWVGENSAPNLPPAHSEIPPFEEARRIAALIGWIP